MIREMFSFMGVCPKNIFVILAVKNIFWTGSFIF